MLISLLLVSGAADAAEIVASAQPVTIGIGESAAIEIELVLAPGEDASVFEGFFDLIGDGTVVVPVDNDSIEPGGPSWSFAAGSAGGQMSIVSLTSNGNSGGTRRVGILTVVGQQQGSFEIRLGSGTSVSRDLPPPVFSEEVPVTTPTGALLAEVQVVAPAVPSVTGWNRILMAAAALLVGSRAVRKGRRANLGVA